MMTIDILDKVATLWPEFVLLIGALICLMLGGSKNIEIRKACPSVAVTALIIAALLISATGGNEYSAFGFTGMADFVKFGVCLVGAILILVAAHVPHQIRQVFDAEHAEEFDPGATIRGEFFAFMLFSLTGVMLVAGANDLVWLFLALELVSLPTYVLVATGRDRIDAQESAVKYFFLGALSAALFLYGFAFIYGATGFTDFDDIRQAIVDQRALAGNSWVDDPLRGLSPMLLLGMLLAVFGLLFKIAAVPMHFYVADVYEGSTTSVTAFLAFVPKTAGFVALVMLIGLIGWRTEVNGELVSMMPVPLEILLWVVAVLTMTVGNVLGLVQNNVKRVLAYSSISHSGYLLIGLLAGPPLASAYLNGDSDVGSAIGNGIAAMLFYLIVYGLATIAGFGVLGSLKVRGEEAEIYDDLAGLSKQHPLLAATMLMSMISLIGLPPFAGLIGKLYLFTSVMNLGNSWYVILLVIAVINSAIAAVYYLRIVIVCFFVKPTYEVGLYDAPERKFAAGLAGVLALLLGIFGNGFINMANRAIPPMSEVTPTMADDVSEVLNSSQVEPSVGSSLDGRLH